MVIHIKGQDLKIEKPVIAEGALKYATFEVRSDKSWKKFNKTVSFLHKETKARIDLPDIEEGKVYYLPENILKSGEVEVAVFGVFQDTFITTSKKSFTVEKSIEDGIAPKITESAYLKFVNDVLRYRKNCEKSEKNIKEMEKNCLEIKEISLNSIKESKNALDKSEKTLEKISGAVDAMGLALKGVKEREEKLLNENSSLIRSEELRTVGEKERIYNEKVRENEEYKRQKNEEERRESELVRMNAEKLRVLMDNDREKKLVDITERLNLIENKNNVCDTFEETVIGENSLTFDKEVPVSEISITSMLDEKPLMFQLNGEEYSLDLMRAGEIADEFILNDEGAYIIRRTSTLTLDGSEDIIEDDNEGERKLYIIPMMTPFAHPDFSSNSGQSTYFTYGKRETTDCVFVSGGFVFLYLSSENKFEVKKKLSDLYKEGRALKITYALLEEKRESVKGIYLPETLKEVKTNDAKIRVKIKRNIFTTFKELSSRITLLEEKLKKGEQK